MTKKFYLAPEVEILDAEMEDNILMVSPKVNTTGLGDDPSDDLVRDDDDSSGDSWESAW